jgi:hypothetical protein
MNSQRIASVRRPQLFGVSPSRVVEKHLRRCRRGRTLDLAGLTVLLAREAGFTYLQHVVALHRRVRAGRMRSCQNNEADLVSVGDKLKTRTRAGPMCS